MKKKTFREMYNMIKEENGEHGAKSFENAIKTKTDNPEDVIFYEEEKPKKKTTKKKVGK